jgi:hypothetical protein
MADLSTLLFDLSQELQDIIFDMMVEHANDADEVIYRRPAMFVSSTSNALLVNKAFSSNFRAALNRRSDQFENLRVSIDSKLDRLLPTTADENFRIQLPPCTTVLHLQLNVHKVNATGYLLPEEIRDIGVLLKEAFEHIDVWCVSLQLKVTDKVARKLPAHYKNFEAYYVNRRLLDDLKRLDWTARLQVQSKSIQELVLIRNDRYALVWMR